MTLCIAVAAIFGPTGISMAQSVDTQIRVAAPRAAPTPRPRPRPADPRDRAYMDGGNPSNPSLSARPSAPAQGELAPRPNMNMEYRPTDIDPPNVATISPTLINPALPGRGAAAAHGAVNQREQRFMDNPAAGARLSVPMTW